MIDSHCHLDQKPLSDDIRNILKRSKNLKRSKKQRNMTEVDII